MKRVLLVVLASAVCVAAAHPLGAAEPRKPGPEHQRFAYLVGDWTVEGMDGQARVTGKASFEWWAGGFHLLRRWDIQYPGVSEKSFAVYEYDPESSSYSFHWINNSGRSGVRRGTVSGDTWTFYSDEKTADGKPLKARLLVKELPPDAMTWTWGGSTDGQTWDDSSPLTFRRVK